MYLRDLNCRLCRRGTRPPFSLQLVRALRDSDAPSLVQIRVFTQGITCRMGLNLFSMQLNEMTPGLESKLPPNDTRWRQDLRAIEKGDYAQVRTSLALCGANVDSVCCPRP